MSAAEQDLVRQLNELAAMNGELIAVLQQLLSLPALAATFDRSRFDGIVARFDQWQAQVRDLGPNQV